MNPESKSRETRTYLLRIPIHFKDQVADVLADLNAELVRKLGTEYFLVRVRGDLPSAGAERLRFVRWSIPMDHVWPCKPLKMEDFIEKAARTLADKFPADSLQGVFVGVLDPSARDGHYKSLAKSLRGRVIQRMGDGAKGFVKVEEQVSTSASLFCLLGEEGLYAGVASPRSANGFYPGGTKFISQSAPHMISRAGAKIAEALHYLRLYREVPPEGSHWLELGACPGGMTSELLERRYRVTAVDRAPLDDRLYGREGLTFHKADVADYSPGPGANFDAVLCDMNGETGFALRQVVRLSRFLNRGGLAVFTLKAAGIGSYREYLGHHESAIRQAGAGGLRLLANTHLTYNRHEFTLFFEKQG
ncbi:SAM-dependent methyltransferase [Haloferula rosea]|uniref:Methyltransferase domain-containing protein n=1 Tax=Haloferula rosea TaxID=490093 RepID=A0A934VGH2_9BACT|nr:SAM-dependent methyltransferase [Haloferula rosea]MBK1828032.1 methyltransferase domain-containing protein [Haloferula rosea]